MTIQEIIITDMKQALREKNEKVRDLLRVVIGEFNRQGKEVSDDVAISIIKKMVQNARDQDVISEAKILEFYLPSQMDELELKRVLMNHIMNYDESPTMKNMGEIMSLLKENYTGQYDGKLASTLVRELLK